MFDPAGIEFKTFPTMAKRIVKAMLQEQNGKMHKLTLYEGGFLLDFYWIDPMVTAKYVQYAKPCK